MKANYLLCIVLLSLCSGCQKENAHCPAEQDLGSVTFSLNQGQDPFNGAMEVFPCTLNTATYYGNMVNNALSVFNPTYVIANGQISGTGVPLLLPLGEYTLLYWGVDSSPSYSAGVSSPAGLSLGLNLSSAYWSLRKIPGLSTYRPAYNQVMAIKNVIIGSDNVNVPLTRVVAGVNVVVNSKNAGTFSSSIRSFDVLIEGISPRLNYISGAADLTSSVSVEFPLTINVNRQQASNLTAMLYPSVTLPRFTLRANLVDGSSKSFTTTLSNPFVAGELQTLTMTIDQITGGTGAVAEFSVTAWEQISETLPEGPFQ